MKIPEQGFGLFQVLDGQIKVTSSHFDQTLPSQGKSFKTLLMFRNKIFNLFRPIHAEMFLHERIIRFFKLFNLFFDLLPQLHFGIQLTKIPMTKKPISYPFALF